MILIKFEIFNEVMMFMSNFVSCDINNKYCNCYEGLKRLFFPKYAKEILQIKFFSLKNLPC